MEIQTARQANFLKGVKVNKTFQNIWTSQSVSLYYDWFQMEKYTIQSVLKALLYAIIELVTHVNVSHVWI